MGEVTVWECRRCGGRGSTEDTIRHVMACPDPSEAQPLTFPVGDGTSVPLFELPP